MNDVGTLKLEWTDPALAFNPDDLQLHFQAVYRERATTSSSTTSKGNGLILPFSTSRATAGSQNRLIEVESNGHVTYLERFSTNFQVDFDWTAFPFDTQDFYIKVDMLYPGRAICLCPDGGFQRNRSLTW